VRDGRLRSRRGGDQGRKARGFRVNINCTLFNDADPERWRCFFDSVKAMGWMASPYSPGYAYERAPDQEHFLNRAKTSSCSATSQTRAMRRGMVVQPLGAFL
jgi:hypothetical protein